MISQKVALGPFRAASGTKILCSTSPTPKFMMPRQQRTLASIAATAISTGEQDSAVLHRSLKTPPMLVVSARERHLTFSDGHEILDSTCGAAVACLGSHNERVKKAMIEQIDKFSYCNSMFFGHPIGEQLCAELIRGTEGAMAKAYIMCSGEYLMPT